MASLMSGQSSSQKWLACILYMAGIDTATNIVGSWSRISNGSDPLYSAPAAVLVTEIAKLIIALLLATVEYDRRPRQDTRRSKEDAIETRFESQPQVPVRLQIMSICDVIRLAFTQSGCHLIALPAAMYVLQNNLRLYALDHLDVVVFNMTSQLKIPATALLSMAFLGMRLREKHWFCIGALLIGILVTQIPQIAAAHLAGGQALGATGPSDGIIKGLGAMVTAAFLSAAAGVYLEKVLKTTSISLWIRQVQLCTFSLLPALMTFFLSSGAAAKGGHSSLLANFDIRTWLAIAMQVVSGLSVALVIKYADNMVKLFAVSLSTVTTALAAAIFFTVQLTPFLLLGGVFINASIFIYGQDPPKRSPVIKLDDMDGQSTSSVTDLLLPEPSSPVEYEKEKHFGSG